MFYGPHFAQAPAPMLRWSKVTAGRDLAVDLDAVKVFLQRPLEDTFFDAETQGLIKVAQSAIEQTCQMVLARSTWRATLPAFYDQVRINRRPFNAVTALQYVAAATGEITDADPDIYQALPVDQMCGMLFLGEGLSWPPAARRHDAVRITVDCGWDVLPDDIAHALMLTVASLDKNRGDEEKGGASTTVYAMKQAKGGGVLPTEARVLLAPYMIKTLVIA